MRCVGSGYVNVCVIYSNQMVNHMVSASPDGRFFACAAFTAEVKLWEMQWGKAAGDPVKAVKVMHLQV